MSAKKLNFPAQNCLHIHCTCLNLCVTLGNAVRWTCQHGTFKYLNKSVRCCSVKRDSRSRTHTHPARTSALSDLDWDLKRTARQWLFQAKDPRPRACTMRPITAACLVRGWRQGDEYKEERWKQLYTRVGWRDEGYVSWALSPFVSQYIYIFSSLLQKFLYKRNRV
jgi:hypothetical protein